MLLIGSALYAQIPELDRLVGKDLWKEPGARERVNAVLGEAHAWKLGEPEPWHVWKTSSGALQYVVLLGASLFEIPGESSARVYFLDAAGKTINGWSFLVGYRIKLNEASIEFSRALDSDLSSFPRLPSLRVSTSGGSITPSVMTACASSDWRIAMVEPRRTNTSTAIGRSASFRMPRARTNSPACWSRRTRPTCSRRSSSSAEGTVPNRVTAEIPMAGCSNN